MLLSIMEGQMKEKFNKILFFLLVFSLLFLTGCNLESDDTEGYLYGYMLTNINDTTQTDYFSPEISEFANYSFSYDFLASHSERDFNFLHITCPVCSSGSVGESALYPFSQNLYFYTNDKFGLIRSIGYDFLDLSFNSEFRQDEVINGESKNVHFGDDFTPGSFYVSEEGEFIIRDSALIRAEDLSLEQYKKVWVSDDDFVNYTPIIELYKNDELMQESELLWYYNSDKRVYVNDFDVNEITDYVFNVSVPTTLPIYSDINTTIKIKTGGSDYNAPYILNLIADGDYEMDQEYKVGFDFVDEENNFESALLKYNLNGGEWKIVELIKGKNNFTGSIYPGEEGEMNLKIFVNDSFGNSQEYFIHPVSLSKQDLEVSLGNDRYYRRVVSPGTYVKYRGDIKDETGRELTNLAINLYHNEDKINVEYTDERGDFDFDLFVPTNYNSSLDTINLRVGGSGIYRESSIVLDGDFQNFNKDVSLDYFEMEDPIYPGINWVNATVSNVGSSKAKFDLNVFMGRRDFVILNTTNVELLSGETKQIPLLIEFYDNYISNEKFMVFLDYDKDMNLENNRLSRSIQIISDYDAAAYISVNTFEIYLGESADVDLILDNEGLYDLYDLDWEVFYYNETGDENVSMCSGSLEKLVRGEHEKTPCEYVFTDLIGWNYIYAKVDNAMDTNNGNNINYGSIRILDPSADIRIEDLDPDVYSVVVDEMIKFNISVKNRGLEKSDLINVSFYYSDNYCSYYRMENGGCSFEDFELISSYPSFALQENGKATILSSYTFKESGDNYLIAYANVSKDADFTNNYFIKRYNVIEKGIDLASYFSIDDDISVDEAVVFNVGYYSFGSEDPESANLSLYYYKGDCSVKENSEDYCFNKDYGLIGSTIVSDFDDGYHNEEFEYAFEESGEYTIFSYINVSGDINNIDNMYVTRSMIRSDQLDYKLVNIYLNSHIIIDEYKTIEVTYYNIGLQEDGTDAILNLYMDDKIVNSTDVILQNIGTRRILPIGFIPDKKGEHKLTVELIIDGETEILNNNISEQIVVKESSDINIKMFDLDNNSVDRFFYMEDSDLDDVIKTRNESLKVFYDKNLRAMIIQNYSKIIEEAMSYVMIESRYHNNLEYKSEFYSSLESLPDKYLITIADVNSQIENTEYVLSFNKEIFEEVLGFGLDYDDLDIVSCETFDSENNICEVDWAGTENKYFYSDEDVIAISSRSFESAQAFALVVLDDFNGESTNLSSIVGVIDNLTIEKSNSGRINFKDSVDSDRLDKKEFKRAIKIEKNRIFVDTNKLTELSGKSANIVFKNVNFKNPQILWNGIPCGIDYCSNIVYDQDSNQLSLDVEGFSEYSIIEGKYCGDGICGSDERCNTCSADCGRCSSGSSGKSKECIPKWIDCEYGPCVDGFQKLICIDSNKCGKVINHPDKEKGCILESDCLDNDGDGYGVGSDCLGIDYDDNDAGVRDEVFSDFDKSGNSGTEKRSFIFLFLISILILVEFLVIYYVFKEHKKETNDLRHARLPHKGMYSKKIKNARINPLLLKYLKEYGNNYEINRLRTHCVHSGYTIHEFDVVAKKLGLIDGSIKRKKTIHRIHIPRKGMYSKKSQKLKINPILLNYLKKHGKQFPLEHLKESAIKAGYPIYEFDLAVKKLGLKE